MYADDLVGGRSDRSPPGTRGLAETCHRVLVAREQSRGIDKVTLLRGSLAATG